MIKGIAETYTTNSETNSNDDVKIKVIVLLQL